MSVANIMVSVDLGAAAADRIELAAGLAQHFGAKLTGVAARRIPDIMPVGDMLEVERFYEIEEGRANEQLEEARALFDREAGSLGRTGWCAALASPLAYLAEQARGADLVVVGRRGPADGNPGPMGVPTGDLLMEVGRPVLVAPPGVERLAAKRVVVAWKDAPEARRAVHDALPFLVWAERIDVVAVGPNAHHRGAEGTAAYLAAHGLAATAHLLPSPGITPADELLRFARHEQADLVVMGAYGHSRLHEWVFGGATRDMLRATPVCCLMSH